MSELIGWAVLDTATGRTVRSWSPTERGFSAAYAKATTLNGDSGYGDGSGSGSGSGYGDGYGYALRAADLDGDGYGYGETQE